MFNLQLFDPDVGTWETVGGGELPLATSFLAGASLGGVFHVLGGNTGSNLKQIISWNPEDSKWEVKGDMSEERYKHAVTVASYAEISQYCIH